MSTNEISTFIVRDICESDPADPNNPKTICINYETLCEIVDRHIAPLLAAHPVAQNSVVRQKVEHLVADGYQIAGTWLMRESDGRKALMSTLGHVQWLPMAQPPNAQQVAHEDALICGNVPSCGATQPSFTGEAVSATFSSCGKYRYSLSRPSTINNPTARPALFCMLNPSTADATKDDATIRRLRGYARDWECAGIVVVNIYALRATDPRELRTAHDPVGPENDEYLFQAASKSRDVICAWGKNAHRDRVSRVLEIFRAARAKTWCLALSKDGIPKHPLYLRADLKPFIWMPGDAPTTSKDG